jgi:hypothetical protein
MSNQLKTTSVQQGGRGVMLRQQNPVSSTTIPTRLGTSPGPGTHCTVFLAINGDGAYANAAVDFVAMFFGREVLIETQTLDPALVADGGALEVTLVNSCAADYWEVRITPTGVPAAPLQSSIVAYGVENFGAGESESSPLIFTTIVTGPTASGLAAFNIPLGTDTFLVTGTMKVLAPGGGSELAGDSYAVTVPSTWENRAGVVTVAPPVLSAPDVSTDADMATATIGPSGTNGTQATVPFETPAGLDAGTTVEVTITLLPLNIV